MAEYTKVYNLSSPIITNGTTYSYTGAVQTVTLEPGKYYISCRGGDGGYRQSSYPGGKGGYVYGELTLKETTTLYLYVGQSGDSSRNTASFNGGGASPNTYGRAAGGATDIRVGTDDLYHRVLVAGGGGSAGYYTKGGDAGYPSGSKGDDRIYNDVTYPGAEGATQTTGYSLGVGESQNDSNKMYGSPGGGGYYGGFCSECTQANNNYVPGGGGGSSYYFDGTNSDTLDAQYTISNFYHVEGMAGSPQIIIGTEVATLQVGDVITYAASSTGANAIWKVMTKGFKIKVDINGEYQGGRTIADIDCTNINNLTLYTYVRSAGLAYGSFSNYAALLYYRLLVAGGRGIPGYSWSSYSAGKGGGITGGNGGGSYSITGGTQTSPGTGSGSAASFGYGGVINGRLSGGAGWYGGGAGPDNTQANGAGGSGFIIGQTTTTYPDGFLDNDTSLQTSLAAAITNSSTTLGGSACSSSNDPAYITITILEIATPEVTQSTLNYYNGTEFKKCYATYYNGTSFIDCDAYYYDGTEFKKIGGE